MAISKSISNKVYKFVHNDDVYIKTNLINRPFKDIWLEIKEDGQIIVKGSNPGGYAWDGCSPKWNFIDLIFGTPDGRFDFNTDKQITYYASMIHDAFYQYKSSVGLSRKEVDSIFKLNLQKSGFMLWRIYYCAVRLFGGFFGRWETIKPQKEITITDFSWIKIVTEII
jgi:hypothetical protein